MSHNFYYRFRLNAPVVQHIQQQGKEVPFTLDLYLENIMKDAAWNGNLKTMRLHHTTTTKLQQALESKTKVCIMPAHAYEKLCEVVEEPTEPYNAQLSKSITAFAVNILNAKSVEVSTDFEESDID